VVQCDAEIGPALNQLSVLVCDRRIARSVPDRQPNFNGDAQTLARPVEGLVNATLATMDDRESWTVASCQTPQNGGCQLVTSPGSGARDYDTHV
jgi:hypothetical protein